MQKQIKKYLKNLPKSHPTPSATITPLQTRNLKHDLGFYNRQDREWHTNVECCFLGGSGTLGCILSSILGNMGSKMIMPYRYMSTVYNVNFRETKVGYAFGNRAQIMLNDFTDHNQLSAVFRDMNTVINCIGSKFQYRRLSEYEEANIHIPIAVAKCVRDSSTVKRLIHVSAAGADPHSPSKQLRTKWYGEQEVKDIYPDVTIIRPTLLYSRHYHQPTFIGRYMMAEGASGLAQPVYATDVADAIINALKMPESVGQTYDIGGPHTYEWTELYEILANVSGMKPYIMELPIENAFQVRRTPYPFAYWTVLWPWLAADEILKEFVDRVVDPKNKGIQDLYIKPISFGHLAQSTVMDLYVRNSIGFKGMREHGYQ